MNGTMTQDQLIAEFAQLAGRNNVEAAVLYNDAGFLVHEGESLARFGQEAVAIAKQNGFALQDSNVDWGNLICPI